MYIRIESKLNHSSAIREEILLPRRGGQARIAIERGFKYHVVALLLCL